MDVPSGIALGDRACYAAPMHTAPVGTLRGTSMMFARPRVLVSCTVLLLAGCTQFLVRSRQDPAVSFAPLRTFAWLPKADAEPADQNVQHRGFDRRIRADVERALGEKGYAPAAQGAAADFLLNYRVTSSPTTATRGNGSLGGWGGYWIGWPGWEAAYTESYDQGAFFIAALDPKTKHMTWLGVAEARLLPHISYDRSLERIDDAVGKILKDFTQR
jgi:hypothetical protein